MQRTAAKWLHRAVSAGFEEWLELVQLKRKRRQILQRTAAKWLHRALSAGFEAWVLSMSQARHQVQVDLTLCDRGRRILNRLLRKLVEEDSSGHQGHHHVLPHAVRGAHLQLGSQHGRGWPTYESQVARIAKVRYGFTWDPVIDVGAPESRADPPAAAAGGGARGRKRS